MDDSFQANPRSEDLLPQVRWLIRLRWIAVAGMVLGALVASLVEDFGVDPYPVIVLAAVLASLNALASWLAQRAGEGGERRTRGFIRGQILLDMVALAFLTTLTGGAYSPFTAYYVFHVIIASILLSAGESYRATGAASALVLIVHAAGGPEVRDDHHAWLILIATMTTLWISAYMATHIVARLREREAETRRLAAELGRRAEELHQANVEIEETRHLETRYMRRVAHELRSPLAATISSLEVVTAGLVGDVPEKQRSIVGRAEARARQLLKMVDDLLLLTSARAPRRPEIGGEPVSVRAEIERVVELLLTRAEMKGIMLIPHLDDAMPVVHADQEGLCQVFTNLVANAIKYTPEGGRVHVIAHARDGVITVKVKDSGIGIAPEDLDRIFDEFYRAPNARSFEEVGTGLGLAIAKGIAESLGGRISVESILGQGATFTLVIPIIPPSEDGAHT